MVLILALIMAYVVFPAPIKITIKDFHPLKPGTWETTLDAKSCTAEGDNKGPWCYQKCYDSASPFYVLCQRAGERYTFDYNGSSKTVLCPRNANYFEQGCRLVSIK